MKKFKRHTVVKTIVTYKIELNIIDINGDKILIETEVPRYSSIRALKDYLFDVCLLESGDEIQSIKINDASYTTFEIPVIKLFECGKPIRRRKCKVSKLTELMR